MHIHDLARDHYIAVPVIHDPKRSRDDDADNQDADPTQIVTIALRRGAIAL
jgi:hypothetical protein